MPEPGSEIVRTRRPGDIAIPGGASNALVDSSTLTSSASSLNRCRAKPSLPAN